MALKNIPHDGQVHFPITVHKNVPECGHVVQDFGQGRFDTPAFSRKSNNARLVSGSPKRRAETIWEATSSAACMATY
jgi:hypothetical protein